MAGSPDLIGRVRSAFANRVVVVVAVVALVAVAAGAVNLYGPLHANDGTAAMPTPAVHHAQPAAPNANVANAVPAPNAANPANAIHAAAPKNAAGPNTNVAANAARSNARNAVAATSRGSNKVQAHAASADAAGAPVVTAVPQAGQQPGSSLAHLDDRLTYQYNALGRRDPFQSLMDGSFVGADVGGDAPPDPGGIKVVGIVWGATDQFALVEDARGNSFVLRKGDKVQNGYVEGLKRDGVIVNITAEGQSQSVVIPLTRKGDQNAR